MTPLKMKVMYRSCVQPSIEYANIIWGGSYDSDILKLGNIHLDAMQLVTGLTARSNIMCMNKLVAILLVIACNFNHAVQNCQRKGPRIFDKYTS